MDIRRNRRTGYLILGVLSLLTLAAFPCLSADWPPTDPREYTTKTDFTLAWAKRLRGFHSLAELQRAAGSKGTISSRALEGNDPYVAYHWRSEPPNKDNVGYMLATVRPNGQIGVSIMTTNNEDVTLNSQGAFVCDKCKPPISITPPGWDDSQ